MRRLIKRVLLSNVVSFSQSLFNSFKSRVLGNSGVVEADSCAVTTLLNLDARNLLQSATFVLAPSGYKSGVIYSQVPSNGNGDLTVTRATTATRVNSAGLIESVGANVPRLDYSLGGCPATLLEPQRTNLVVRSEEFDNASWGKQNGSSVSANTTTAPDGVSSADTLTASTSNFSSVRQIYTIQLAGTYTFSFYAKQNTKRWIYWVDQNGANARVWFDLQNGVLGAVQSGYTASMISVGDGWYRCVVTTSPTNIHTIYQIGISEANNGVNCTTTGSVFIWGAQMEAGAFVSTYIQTTNATVTRLTDTFTRNNIYTNGLISASGFTWLFEIKNNISIKGDQTDNTKFYGMFIGNSSTAPTSAICIYNDNTTALLKLGTISGTVTTPRYTTAAASIKVAITYDGTTLNAWVNGTQQISALSFSATLSAFEHLAAINTDVPKYIAQMALWNTILPDSQCASLTS